MKVIPTGSGRSIAKRVVEHLKEYQAEENINGTDKILVDFEETDFGNTEQVLSSYGEIECWNCSMCKLKEHCLYKEEEKVYKALKNQYTKNSINQNDLKEVLSL